MTLGRKSTSTVIFREQAISSEHCRLEMTEDEDGNRVVFLQDCSSNGTFLLSPHDNKSWLRMSPRGRQVISSGTEVVLVPPQLGKRDKVSVVVYIHDPKVSVEAGGPHMKYDLRDVLGSGGFAQVRLCINKYSGEKFACKIVDKQKFRLGTPTARADALTDEVDILRNLDHPNIVKVHECFDTDRALYIILEVLSSFHLLVNPCRCWRLLLVVVASGC